MKMILMALVAAAPMLAQSGVPAALAKHWKVTGDFTIEVAKAMPPESYNFRPSPEEMTFGQVMAHIGLANLGACANASGLPRPSVPAKLEAWSKDPQKVDVQKEAALEFLTEAFAFCNKAVAGITAERLDQVQGPAARNMTGFEWLWSYFTHTAHHRGQAEVYLRVKGIKPPTYVF
jgi:uncharacterized damage-inducible protein DinB